jgi:hypothetical protein
MGARKVHGKCYISLHNIYAWIGQKIASDTAMLLSDLSSRKGRYRLERVGQQQQLKGIGLYTINNELYFN